MKIFEFAILIRPTEDEKKNGKSSEIVVPITSCLAKDEAQAALLAGRAIPEAMLDKVDRMEVAVRPF